MCVCVCVCVRYSPLLLLFRVRMILGVVCALVESCEGITGRKAVLSSWGRRRWGLGEGECLPPRARWTRQGKQVECDYVMSELRSTCLQSSTFTQLASPNSVSSLLLLSFQSHLFSLRFSQVCTRNCLVFSINFPLPLGLKASTWQGQVEVRVILILILILTSQVTKFPSSQAYVSAAPMRRIRKKQKARRKREKKDAYSYYTS